MNPDKFDLIITDMTMPNINGAELAKGAMFVRPDIPVMLCSGHSGVITEAEAKAIGIRELVMKPLAMNDLALLIRQILDGGQD